MLTLFAVLVVSSIETIVPESSSDWWEYLMSPQIAELEESLQEIRNNIKETLPAQAEEQPVLQIGHVTKDRKIQKNNPAWISIDLGKPRRIQRVALFPAHIYWATPCIKYQGFPTRFHIEVSQKADFSDAFLLVENTAAHCQLPPIGPWISKRLDATFRYIRLVVTETKSVFKERHFFALGEFMVISGKQNVAAGCKVSSSDPLIRPPYWSPAFATDGINSYGPPVEHLNHQESGSAAAAGSYYTRPKNTTGLQVVGSAYSRPQFKLSFRRFAYVEEIRLYPFQGGMTKSPDLLFPTHARLTARVPSNNKDKGKLVTLFSPLEEGMSPRLNNPMIVRFTPPVKLNQIIIEQLKKHPVLGWTFALSEVEIISNGINIAPRASVKALPAISSKKKHPRTLVDGLALNGRLLSTEQWLYLWEYTQRLIRNEKAIANSLASQRRASRRTASVALLVITLLLLSALVVWRKRVLKIHQNQVTSVRHYLASELHDEIGSNMAALALLGQTAAQSHSKSEEDKLRHASKPLLDDWNEVTRLARESTSAMRDILWLSGSRSNCDTPLIEQLQRSTSRLLKGHEVNWKGTIPSKIILAPEAQRQLCLAYREVLTNIAQYGNASQITINFGTEAGFFELYILDNGRNYRISAQAKNNHVGIVGAAKRLQSIGGQLRYHKTPNGYNLTCLSSPEGNDANKQLK